MPAVVGERGLLRVALHHLDPGPDHQAAPDLDILQLLFSRRKRPVHQFGKARAKAVIYPVAGSNRFCRHFGSNKFTHIVLYHLFSPSKIYIAIFLKRLMSLDTLLDPHIIMVQTFCPLLSHLSIINLSSSLLPMPASEIFLPIFQQTPFISLTRKSPANMKPDFSVKYPDRRNWGTIMVKNTLILKKEISPPKFPHQWGCTYQGPYRKCGSHSSGG